jgi:hypothetical protein
LVGLFPDMLFSGGLGVDKELEGEAIAYLGVPFLSGAIGGICLVASKRLRARLDLAKKIDDVRAPVIYLRSFQIDKKFARRPWAIGRVVSVSTEEEQLVSALDEIGRVIAIGKPGERLPRLVPNGFTSRTPLGSSRSVHGLLAPHWR